MSCWWGEGSLHTLATSTRLSVTVEVLLIVRSEAKDCMGLTGQAVLSPEEAIPPGQG